MSSEVATKAAGTLALPADVLAALAGEAKDAAAKERPSLGRFSLRSGILAYNGNELPNNKTEAVVLAAAYRRVWYAGSFDPDNLVSPNCFSSDENDEDMVPSENVTDPPSKTCKDCPKNQWGTATKQDGSKSRGKACKETRRLVLMPAAAVDKGAEEVLKAELGVLDLPVTSAGNYSNFVNVLAASANVPPHAAIAEVHVVADRKTQFQVKMTPMRVLPTLDVLEAVKKRREEALRIVLEPYAESAAPVDSKDQVVPEAQRASAKAKKF